ncbi:hypothetical protein AYO47_01780 [Planctomyces sp. SCGC AG-212-M04]|nr:hypothetical protein AYO47_01780 [Planctomyces sp. SCGC AG-212-M04]
MTPGTNHDHDPVAAASGGTTGDDSKSASIESSYTRTGTLAVTMSRYGLVLPILTFLIPAWGSAPSLTTVLLVALAASALQLASLFYIWRPRASAFRFSSVAFALTAMVTAPSLWHWTEMIVSHATPSAADSSLATSPLALLGRLYLTATTEVSPDKPVSEVLIAIAAAIVSIGLFEELVKLLPTLAYCACHRQVRTRDSAFIGAVSGVAFGMYEGFVVSRDVYFPEHAPISLFILRFAGCTLAHAIFAALSSALFATILRVIPGRVFSSGPALIVLAAISALCIAVPHGIYDGMLQAGIPQIAGLIMVGCTLGALGMARRVTGLPTSEGP